MVVLGAAAQAGRAGVGWARVSEMQFAMRLREHVRRGRIRCTVRVWTHLHVKVGGRYPMEEGHVVVDSVETISEQDVTHDLARESGFESVAALMKIAKHGKGEKIYLIRFHYLRAGEWDRGAS